MTFASPKAKWQNAGNTIPPACDNTTHQGSSAESRCPSPTPKNRFRIRRDPTVIEDPAAFRLAIPEESLAPSTSASPTDATLCSIKLCSASFVGLSRTRGLGVLRRGGVTMRISRTRHIMLSAPSGEWTMANISRPPCDEAAILAGSCERPALTNGPWILAATILGSSMAFIDGTVVNVALPALQSALHATLADVQWVVDSYGLFLAALLLIGGSLGDLYGRRKIFAAGVVLFTVASAWCGLAPNIRQLIVARGLQGIGGALLVPGSLALISVNYSQEQRGRAIGTWSWFHVDHLCHRPCAGVDDSWSTVCVDGYFSLTFRCGWPSCCKLCGESRKAGPAT